MMKGLAYILCIEKNKSHKELFLCLCKEQTAKAKRNQNRGCSGDSYEFVFGHIVADRVLEVDGLPTGDAGNVDAPIDELVDEGAIVVGTYAAPTVIVDLAIE